MTHRLAFIVSLLLALPVWGQVSLVQGGKARAAISLHRDTPENRRAAQLLNLFLGKITGDTLPVTLERPRKGDVVIGEKTGRAGEDGFELDSRDGKLHIKTGGGRGAVYGAVTVVDDYMGVDYWAHSTYTLTPAADVSVPRVRRAETPTFRYRQTYSYGNGDPVYRDWMRLRQTPEVFAGDLWVHTTHRLLPATRYGSEHPEWYAVDGEGNRMIGEYSQWCLSDPGLFEAACQAVDSVFRANPGKDMISVSQNDRGDNYCQCERCRAVIEEEGSPSGPIIRFMNRLARRFPDKQFSTLAYQYSRKAPRKTRPLPNVNIMLCDIECTRELPLEQTDGGREFARDLEEWSRISDNIYIWDYGINFDNLVSPFPNFHVLGPNIRLFRDRHATMLHEQVNGVRGTDLAEMRAYVLARLMWDADQDTDSLMEEFARAYYGKAAPYILEYNKLRTGQLLGSGRTLRIYDTPTRHKDGMLSAENCRRYDALFDKAEEAVRGQADKTRHVQMARLPLMFSQLEIARTQGGDRRPASTGRTLERFDSLTAALRVGMLHERGFSPREYVDVYRERYLPADNRNLASGARFTWLREPTQRYMSSEKAERALTDGLYGGFVYSDGWAGWVGTDPEFIVDLGEVKEFTSVGTDFLHQPGAWVLLPTSGEVEVSTDGSDYRLMGTWAMAEDRTPTAKFAWGRVTSDKPVQARYLRLRAHNVGPLPDWHIGAGSPSCVFIDEVKVE